VEEFRFFGCPGKGRCILFLYNAAVSSDLVIQNVLWSTGMKF
jgi:hypothetical protein